MLTRNFSLTMDIEHWSGFTDVELNSLKQRGRGRRNTRRSRGQPLNQGTRKVVYPIGRAGTDATKASTENLPSGAFFSHEIRSPSNNSTPVDRKIHSDTRNVGDNSVADQPISTNVEKNSVSTESSGDSGVALTERSARLCCISVKRIKSRCLSAIARNNYERIRNSCIFSYSWL